MEHMQRKIQAQYESIEIQVFYTNDLPNTFEDEAFFIRGTELDTVLNYLAENDVLRPKELKEFRGGNVRKGFITLDNAKWEAYAYDTGNTFGYHVVCYKSNVSAALSPKTTLFRFHNGGTVFESIKHAFVIRDLKELENIIRARGFAFNELSLRPYGYDGRIDWCTYLVSIDGRAVGYTNSLIH